VSVHILRDVRKAFQNLNPGEVRDLAERPLRIGVLAVDDALYSRAISFLIPTHTSDAKAAQAARCVARMASEQDLAQCDLGLAESGLPHPPHFYGFDVHEPAAVIRPILDDHEDLWIPLAQRFLPFREPVIERVIWKISKENAFFAVATGVPNVVPSLLSLPWAAGEFASDTAFLTMNQVRMAFLIAAASDSNIGYREQRAQIGSIVAAAFGWRAIARELVSKIPAGGGLLSKGLVAFAGTYAVGVSLDHFLRLGRGLTRAEKKQHYDDAWVRGRAAVQQIIDRLTKRTVTVRGV
jgi:hypothetical protein